LSYVRQFQWKKLATNQLIIMKMNDELAGEEALMLPDIITT
jgi:hypothetical protein